jgi:hypothetical protein
VFISAGGMGGGGVGRKVITESFIVYTQNRICDVRLTPVAQGEGVVYVSSTMHRTFGLGDWQQLHTLLSAWKENLNTVKEQLAHVASTQVITSH